jgi:thiol-disulfide isomerase/thioredoxin
MPFQIKSTLRASLAAMMLVSFLGCTKSGSDPEAATKQAASQPIPWNERQTGGSSNPSDEMSQVHFPSPVLTGEGSGVRAIDDGTQDATPKSGTASNNPSETSPSPNTSNFKVPPIAYATGKENSTAAPEIDFTGVALPGNAGPEEIINHLVELDKSLKNLLLTQQAKRISRDEAIRQASVLSQMKYAAAEKLAQVAETPLHKDLSVLAKIEALSQSAGMGEEKAARELRSLAGDPSNFTSKRAAHQAAIAMLGLELSDLVGGLKDATPVLNQLEVVLSDPTELKRPDFFAVAQVVRILDQHNIGDAAQSAKKRIAAAFEQNLDPQIGAMLWQLQITDSPEFNAFNEAVDSENAPVAPFESIVEGLWKLAPSQWTLGYFLQRMTQVEYSGQVDKAQILAAYVEQNAALLAIPELAGEATKALASLKKRMSAVGKPIAFDGLAIQKDGQEIDPKSLEGKVVLIDFWASWCQPCRAEFPNLREQYAKYHERGFEIVGINLDEDISAMQSVLQSDSLPWIHARSNDASKLGFATPQAVEFGVEAIPFLMLAGPDGKVLAVHTRGKILNDILGKLFPVE